MWISFYDCLTVIVLTCLAVVSPQMRDLEQEEEEEKFDIVSQNLFLG